MFMRRNFLKEGNHSWDLVHEYHRCDSCGKIFESRGHYEDRYGKLEMDLECPSCHHEFTVRKERTPSLGPLFGRS